ncbi:SpoIIIAH-like family protein [Oscillibacter sp.]|jgi:stage III sporulation protein AH|uniref:SpoIIIAH-like family protein n=1 Tax=Oscillibacter sp. TaxID=1945593 RepID=UPI00216C11B8|nr:SpoIIIAH-like family protein [Oscillibacter sp.]MCI9240618.1 SpoIIIAH-like family protein [Oscillibacter sp.]
MSARWKRNAVVAVMAVLVCSAVALNWLYTGQEVQEASGGKLLGEAQLVSGKGTEKTGEEEKTGEGEQAPAPAEEETGAPPDEGMIYTGSDYFASARLTRQQARDNALSLLQEAAEQENADAAVANEASQGIQVLASYTLAEAQIENLVTAKGYTDCVAFMGDECVSVVVSTKSGDLTAEDVAKITDITMTETGLPAGNIKIMAAN